MFSRGEMKTKEVLDIVVDHLNTAPTQDALDLGNILTAQIIFPSILSVQLTR